MQTHTEMDAKQKALINEFLCAYSVMFFRANPTALYMYIDNDFTEACDAFLDYYMHWNTGGGNPYEY